MSKTWLGITKAEYQYIGAIVVVSEKWNQQIDMATLQEHLRQEFAVGPCHTVIEITELFSLVVRTHMLAFQDFDNYL